MSPLESAETRWVYTVAAKRPAAAGQSQPEEDRIFPSAAPNEALHRICDRQEVWHFSAAQRLMPSPPQWPHMALHSLPPACRTPGARSPGGGGLATALCYQLPPLPRSRPAASDHRGPGEGVTVSVGLPNAAPTAPGALPGYPTASPGS